MGLEFIHSTNMLIAQETKVAAADLTTEVANDIFVMAIKAKLGEVDAECVTAYRCRCDQK